MPAQSATRWMANSTSPLPRGMGCLFLALGTARTDGLSSLNSFFTDSLLHSKIFTNARSLVACYHWRPWGELRRKYDQAHRRTATRDNDGGCRILRRNIAGE